MREKAMCEGRNSERDLKMLCCWLRRWRKGCKPRNVALEVKKTRKKKKKKTRKEDSSLKSPEEMQALPTP